LVVAIVHLDRDHERRLALVVLRPNCASVQIVVVDISLIAQTVEVPYFDDPGLVLNLSPFVELEIFAESHYLLDR
jgi:hypothetical protein